LDGRRVLKGFLEVSDRLRVPVPVPIPVSLVPQSQEEAEPRQYLTYHSLLITPKLAVMVPEGQTYGETLTLLLEGYRDHH